MEGEIAAERQLQSVRLIVDRPSMSDEQLAFSVDRFIHSTAAAKRKRHNIGSPAVSRCVRCDGLRSWLLDWWERRTKSSDSPVRWSSMARPLRR